MEEREGEGATYVGDAKLKVGADDAEEEAGEGEGPVGAVSVLEADEQEGEGVAQGADAHEELVGHPVHDESRNNLANPTSETKSTIKRLLEGVVLTLTVMPPMAMGSRCTATTSGP